MGVPEISRQETGRNRVTIRTVATHAGVSVTAVSKVTRNAYGVSQKLREKVENSIAILGYRPSRAAQGLRGKTHTIGVLLIDIRNPFLGDIIVGVNNIMAPSNYRAMIGVGESKTQLETSLIESMIDYKMDGLVLVAPSLPTEIISEYAKQIPIVAIGYHDSSAVDFDTVNTDDQKGAALVVEAFVARGYRDVGMLSLTSGKAHRVSVVRQREIGFRKALKAAGIDNAPIIKIGLDALNRDQLLRSYLNSPKRPRAIFCWSDLDAIQVLDIARELELRVPEDLAIAGFDNTPTAGLTSVSLSSIDQNGIKIGESAADILLERIGGREHSLKILIEPALVPRGSMSG